MMIHVVVVLWKSREFIDELFRGLELVEYPRDQFVVHIVDNQSPDGAGEYVRQKIAGASPNLPRVILHEPGSNTGFAGGNNLIMRRDEADCYYLLNHDAAFEPGTLREAVLVAESHPNAGSIQSLLVLMQDVNVINSTGNAIHFAGFGYCDGYLRPVAESPADVRPIGYASGAGVLYRAEALKRVGLFDETLFAYHEDLDLGWRLTLAGYDNLLAPKSVLRHKYEFSRSISKWYWMERNRGIVMLVNYRLPTIFLILPALFGIEIATWLFAFRGGWWKEKWGASVWFLKPSSWKYLFAARKRVQKLRTRSDREILKRFVATIEHQDSRNFIVEKIANPLLRVYFSILKTLVVW